MVSLALRRGLGEVPPLLPQGKLRKAEACNDAGQSGEPKTAESKACDSSLASRPAVAPIAARRGLVGVPALVLAPQVKPLAQDPKLALPRLNEAVASAPPLELGAPSRKVDSKPQEVPAKPLSIAARRGLTLACGISPPSVASPEGTVEDAAEMKKPGCAVAVKPLALCARRGLEQKSLQVPPLDLGKAIGKTLHDKLELSSPSPSESGASTVEGEPMSPSLSDISIEDWGYDMLGSLGQGTMGVVNGVRRRSDGKEFACKHVRSGDREPLVELKREYELLESLSHESIVSPHALYECLNNAWLLMQWCKGGSIEDRILNKGAIAEPRAMVLAHQLLAGVDYMHSRRMVHCDIKPANLLLHPEDGDLKIADFGSARKVGCAAAGLVMLSERGSQLYSAPEMRFGRQWNERVDIWASGLCIFFMLCADLPFDGAARKAKKQLLAGRLPELAWGHRGSIGESTRELVTQCLTVEMRDRPTAMELVRHSAFGANSRPSPKSLAARDSPTSCGLAVLPTPTSGSLPTSGMPSKDHRDVALMDLVHSRAARSAGHKWLASGARSHESFL